MKKLSTFSGETIKCYHASAKHMTVPWFMTGLLFFVGISVYFLFIYPQSHSNEGTLFFDSMMLGLVAVIACGMITSLWAETKGTFLYLSDGGIEYLTGWYLHPLSAENNRLGAEHPDWCSLWYAQHGRA